MGLRMLTSIFTLCSKQFIRQNYTLLTAPGAIVPDLYILVASESIQVPRRVKLDARDGIRRDGGEERSESSGSEHAVKECGTMIRGMYRRATGSCGERKCVLKI